MRKNVLIFGTIIIIIGLLSPWIFSVIDKLISGHFTVKPYSLILIRKRLAPGYSAEGHFTVSGGDGGIEFNIRDPYRTIIYNATVYGEHHFTFTPETKGVYTLIFNNRLSDNTSKQVSLIWRGMPVMVGLGSRTWFVIVGSIVVILGVILKPVERPSNINLKNES